MYQKITDVDFKDKTVLLRCDFNVPLDENGRITNDKRLRAAIETIRYLHERANKMVLFSHLGRPKDAYEAKYSMAPIAEALTHLLNEKVTLIDDPEVVSEHTYEIIEKAPAKSIFLLQNTRFRKEEKKNDPQFAKALAGLGHFFVNDAFGAAHRAHASTAGICEFLPSTLGFLMQKEVDALEQLMDNPKRPFVAILGGAKVSDKIGVINHLMEKVDCLIIGGAMAFTFLSAKGFCVGKSLCETDKIEVAKQILHQAEEKKVSFLLPIDVVCADRFDSEAESAVHPVFDIPAELMGLDIGPKTVSLFKREIQKAGSIVWNGPMGVFEFEKFAEGTIKIAEALSDASAYTLVGGGDSVAAIEKFHLQDKINHISTGGGASLEFLEGKILPGIAAVKGASK